MTVRDFVSVAKGNAEYTVACNGNAYPFSPDDQFQMTAYGDFQISGAEWSVLSRKDQPPVIVVEIELNQQLVKEVRA